MKVLGFGCGTVYVPVRIDYLDGRKLVPGTGRERDWESLFVSRCID